MDGLKNIQNQETPSVMSAKKNNVGANHNMAI